MILRPNSILSRIVQKLLGILCLAGFLGFLAGFVSSCGGLSWLPSSTEFPLGDPQDIVVDPAGRIYLGLHFYNRVQQYDSNGYFLRSWPVAESHFRLYITPRGSLMVSARESSTEFDGNGKSIPLSPNFNPTTLPARRSDVIETADGGLEIRNPIIFPRVVSIRADGRERTLIQQPWYRWPITGPLPAWLCMAGSAVVASRLFPDKKPAPGEPTL